MRAIRSTSDSIQIEYPWTYAGEEILCELNSSVDRGLTTAEVKARQKKYGKNLLREPDKKGSLKILVNQFKSLIIGLLAAASLLSFFFKDWMEGVVIIAVIFINAAIGFFTEIKAVRSMEALRRLSRVTTVVLRDGQVQQVPAEELVPGDIVLLDSGDIVSADLRLVEVSKLQADESMLTGESMPVGKQIDPLDKDTLLAERTNMLFKGTAVTRGSGLGVVAVTGMATEMGQISAMIESAEEEVTPIEKRLNQLGHKLIWVTLVLTLIVASMGIARGKGVLLMIETAIALAVAAIPEGLPIVATIALARGMLRMARRNAIINRLASVETLGATNVIFTDKTGTLTENRMTAARIRLASGIVEIGQDASEQGGEFMKGSTRLDPGKDTLLREALTIGVLCNNASLGHSEEGGGIGDPMEVALLAAGAKAGLLREELSHTMPEAREEAFDPDTKMMATFNRVNHQFKVAVKGAPESVLEVCSSIATEEGLKAMHEDDRKEWLKMNSRMAEDGLRVLALASKMVPSTEVNPYEQLHFLALVGLIDPPRREVSGSIALCREAGIRVIMVTGDQPVTARNIAATVSLLEGEEAKNREVIQGRDLKPHETLSEEEQRRILQVPVFARVSPRQKLDLISIHQAHGAVVAMTGDGVNDGPALKKADIGIAMGKRGTQVAREASDMILKDDAFSTIVLAVQQGRVIFGNIRKFVLYLLSCNVSEIFTVAVASLFNIPLPVLPLQILFLNLVTDVFPALALGVGEGDPGIMKRPPRDPKEPIITRQQWFFIGGFGCIIAGAVLGALTMAFFWLKMEKERAITVSFLTLALAQLWHVLNMRDPGSSFYDNDITRNRYVWGALVLCTILLLSAIYIPWLSGIMMTLPPGLKGWSVVLFMSIVPVMAGQILKLK